MYSKTRIVDALAAKRPEDALALLDQYHLLESKGVTMPPVLHFSEARMAVQTKDMVRAFEALTRYLGVAQSSDSSYGEAIRWYAELEKNASLQSDVAAKNAKKAAAERLAVEQAQRAARVINHPNFEGAEFSESAGRVLVSAVSAGSPAERSLLRVGDHIV